MSDLEKMGVIRATALAAVNAVIKEAGLGLFMSEYDKIYDNGSLYWRVDVEEGHELSTHTFVTIAGRTNTGEKIWASAIVAFKQRNMASPSEEFPIKAVYVAVRKPPRPDVHHHDYNYYECTFGIDEFRIRQIEQSESERLTQTKT